MIQKPAVAALCLCLGAVSAAQAGERGTPDEAKALATKAADCLKANGAESSFAASNKADGGFRDRDLYVFVNDQTGKMMANGGVPALIGRNNIDLKDVEGKPFVRDMIAIKDSGRVERRWPNPQTKAVETKTAYIVHIDTHWLGVGASKS